MFDKLLIPWESRLNVPPKSALSVRIVLRYVSTVVIAVVAEDVVPIPTGLNERLDSVLFKLSLLQYNNE